MRRFLALLPALVLAGCSEDTPNLADPSNPSLGPSAAVVSAWTNKAAMPTARSFFAIATIKNSATKSTIYLIGGLVNGNASAVVEAYNTATNTWTKKASLPAKRFLTNGATVINGKIYVVGGWGDAFASNPSGGFWEYTPGTNKWRVLPPGPYTGWCCGSGASGVIAGKLYVFQGNDAVDSQRLDRWDPVTQTWTRLSDSNFPHDGAAGVVIGGKFYVFGFSDALEAYDPATDTWTTKASMLLGRGLGTAVVNGKLYVFGGTDEQTGMTTDLKIYDPATNQWSHGIPMNTLRAGTGAAAVTKSGKTSVYVIGGDKGWATIAVKTNQLFDPTIANRPPVAKANGPYLGTVAQPVQFSAQGTFDPEGAWNGTWTFGDGTSYTGVLGDFTSQNPQHTYLSPGSYSVTLTVTDMGGLTASASTTAAIQ